MTIEKLLNCEVEQLEKMTDETLKKHFEPYLKFTRPELAEKQVNIKKSVYSDNPHKAEKLAKKAKANAILEQLGLDVKL